MARRRPLLKSRILRCTAWAGCLPLLGQFPARAETPTPAAAAEQDAGVDSAALAALVKSLDDDRFDAREAAQQRLLALGAEALGAVGHAAAAGSLESSTRAVSILMQWSQSEDNTLSLGALELLAALTNRPAEAAMATDRLAEVREVAAMNAIVELGGRVEYDRPATAFVGPPSLRIVIGPKWTGGQDGLKHIANMRRASTVSLYSASITGDDAVPALAKIPQLIRVEIFGTDVSDDALTELRESLPHALVDVRGGARLGISMGNLMPAQVGEVQPGTAAENAGLISGDIITEIDGVAVADFTALTAQIAKVKPGDKITLKVLRMGALGQPQPTPIDVTVEFARWGDEQTVNPTAPSPLGGVPTAMPAEMFLNQR